MIEANLASRPVRNERVSWAVAFAAALTLAALTFAHARAIAGLIGGKEAASTAHVRANEARIAEIERSLRDAPPPKVDAATAARHRAYKQIVDRRTFSWTGLLAALEDALPGEARLVRVVPEFGDAGVTVDLAAEARSREAAFGFAEALERSDSFGRARIRRLGEIDGGVAFDLTVTLEAVPPAGGES